MADFGSSSYSFPFKDATLFLYVAMVIKLMPKRVKTLGKASIPQTKAMIYAIIGSARMAFIRTKGGKKLMQIK